MLKKKIGVRRRKHQRRATLPVTLFPHRRATFATRGLLAGSISFFLQADNSRQSRLVTLAMSARAEAVSSYSKMKQESEDVHRRFKETQVCIGLRHKSASTCCGKQFPLQMQAANHIFHGISVSLARRSLLLAKKLRGRMNGVLQCTAHGYAALGSPSTELPCTFFYFGSVLGPL